MRRRRGVIASLLTAGGLLGLLLAGGSAQAAAWQDASSPTPAIVASQAGLQGVSCSSAHACMAVGTLLAGSGRTLAERWNGTAWAVSHATNPKGATNSNFYAVSCSAANACMATGQFEDAAAPDGVPLAEVWNGKTWTVKHVPNPRGGTNGGLYGVSCSTARACVAVGNVIIKGHNNAFSEAWNGKTWTLKTTPRPAGTTYSLLGAVSCRSATFCIAVGNYELHNTSTARTLAEAWHGKAWTIQATPNPKDGVNGDGLNGVACTSRLACLAVGSYQAKGSTARTLAESWNGKTWTIKTPHPKGAPGSSLTGVSCRAVNRCMAAGGSGANAIFAEAWNGRAWTLKTLTPPKDASFTSLNGVSCGANASCVAVGDEFDSSSTESPVVEVWNGTTWTLKPVPL
jgi:hypothetical protein